MNKEEEKIFKFLKNVYKLDFKTCIIKNCDVKNIFNLIEKQQKEIEKLKSRKYIFNAVTKEINEIPISDDYISKDKIKEKLDEYKTKKANMTQIIFSKYGKTQQTFKQAVNNEVIKVLKELIEGE